MIKRFTTVLALVTCLTAGCYKSVRPTTEPLELDGMCETVIALCEDTASANICNSALVCIELRDYAADTVVDLKRCKDHKDVDKQECSGQKKTLADKLARALKHRWVFGSVGVGVGIVLSIVIALLAG